MLSVPELTPFEVCQPTTLQTIEDCRTSEGSEITIDADGERRISEIHCCIFVPEASGLKTPITALKAVEINWAFKPGLSAVQYAAEGCHPKTDVSFFMLKVS